MQQKKPSPYTLLFNWIFDNNINSPIPEEVIKSKLNAKYLLLNFIKNPKLCKFLNDSFNTYEVHAISNEDIFKELKLLCMKLRMTKNDILYIPYNKIKEMDVIKKLKKRLHYLKVNEIKYLYENYYDDDLMQEFLKAFDIINQNENIKKPKKEVKKAIKFKDLIGEYENIKQNSKECQNCELNKCPLVLFDTNTKSNICNVDVLFVAEAPGQTEVEKGVPLIGRSGQKLRQYIQKYLTKDKVKWFMTNTCLCRPDNNATPSDNSMMCCSKNLDDIISKTEPKLIIPLGSTALKRLGYVDDKISKVSGQLLDYKDNIKCIPLLHPSAIIRNAFPESYYDEGFKNILNFLNGNDLNDSNVEIEEDDVIANIDGIDIENDDLSENNNIINSLDDINLNNLDNNQDSIKQSNNSNDDYIIDSISGLKINKNIIDDYYLVDVHKNNDMTPLYILRHKQTHEKRYFFYNEYNNYYFWHNPSGNIYENINNKNTTRVHVNYKNYVYSGRQIENYKIENMYEGDMDIEDKHSALYFRNISDVDEIAKYSPKVMYLDIEVYAGEYKGFPKPEDANFPINAITYTDIDKKFKTLILIDKSIHKNITNDNVNEYMYNVNNLDNNDPIKKLIDIYKDKTEFVVFYNERNMMNYFLDDLCKIDPDIITAWNVSFDIGYIYNRLRKHLNINPNKLSPVRKTKLLFSNSDDDSLLGSVDIDLRYKRIHIDGVTVIDLLDLYKQFTFESQESYTLSFIAKKELKDDKIEYEDDNLSNLYVNNLFRFIWYNIKDVEILIKLDDKLKHINLLNVFRIQAKSSWESCKTTNGSADNLLVNKLKEHNIIVRNFVGKYINKEKIPGAYVMTPEGGIYNYVIDLDFASLYPNVIRTFNIGHDTLCGNVVDENVSFYYLFNKSKLKEDTKIRVELNLFQGGNKFKEFSLKEFNEFMKDKILTISGAIYYKHSVKKSLLYDIMTSLLDSRKVYKNKMFEAIENNNEDDRSTYNNMQLSFKTLANSIYGILLYNASRWFNKDMGKSITQSSLSTSKFSAIFCDAYMKKLVGDESDINNKELLDKFNREIYEKDIKTKYVIYMDTDSLYVNINPLVKDEKDSDIKVKKIINEIAPKLSSYLNNEVLREKLIKGIYNIEEEHSKFLVLKQEVIAKTAFFKANTKKKYALYIINREGKSLNEQDIKGLETKRSDFPSLTKERLTQLLDLILQERIDIMKIQAFITKTEKEILEHINQRSRDIAKPVTFSKSLDQYKTASQHIKGMVYWNELEYYTFMQGVKGYLFYIKGIDLNRAPDNVVQAYKSKYMSLRNKYGELNAIVIPTNLKRLPDYYIIDKQRSIEFAWNERHKQLIGDMISIVHNKKENRQIPTF